MHLLALWGLFTDQHDRFPYPFIYLKPEKGTPFGLFKRGRGTELGTTVKKSSKWPERRDSNPGPPDCESNELTTRPRCLRIGHYREYPPPPPGVWLITGLINSQLLTSMIELTSIRSQLNYRCILVTCQTDPPGSKVGSISQLVTQRMRMCTQETHPDK